MAVCMKITELYAANKGYVVYNIISDIWHTRATGCINQLRKKTEHLLGRSPRLLGYVSQQNDVFFLPVGADCTIPLHLRLSGNSFPAYATVALSDGTPGQTSGKLCWLQSKLYRGFYLLNVRYFLQLLLQTNLQ
jgi:hypothetical protein